MDPDTYLWKDPAGRWHRVRVIERRQRSAVIEYFDNSNRGERVVRGRRYNHATRQRVVVWLRELRDVGPVGAARKNLRDGGKP